MLLTDSLNLTHENLLTLIDIVILPDSNTCDQRHFILFVPMVPTYSKLPPPSPCQSRLYLIQILV